MVHNMNERSNNETSSYVLSSTVAKAFQILEFIAENQPVSPTNIVKSLKLTRSNVHRLLATLVDIGYVNKDDNGYFLSFKLFQLGNTIPFTRDLKSAAKPFMSSLMKEANENVYLNVCSGDTVIAIDSVRSDNHLTLNSEKIYTYPLNTCASGKVFLSMLSEESAIEKIENLEIKKMTDSTIISKSVLLNEIKDVKVKGFATEFQEFSDELNSVAAPVYDYRGYLIATVSLSGPAVRLDSLKIDKLVDKLISTSNEITNQLGK